MHLLLLLFTYAAFVSYCHDADFALWATYLNWMSLEERLWSHYYYFLLSLQLSIVRKDMLESYLLLERICLRCYGLFPCEIVVWLCCYGIIVRIIIACLPLYCYGTYYLSYGLLIGKLLKLLIRHTKIVYLSHGSTSCCIELNTRYCYYFIIWKNY